ncbi:hypothetical protein EJB05_22830 [Eragrostis curvula]|uniref:Uncharacterized protein n=1 Tax=Eragrostis curvula TaxID=38414 RepID=A0A5J9V6M0_9POAL|nr:hypothetical protein EJB05_22830 [Eragrostis curvula]
MPAPSRCSASATRGRTSPPKHGTPSRLPRPSTQTSPVRLTASVGLTGSTKATKVTDIKMAISRLMRRLELLTINGLFIELFPLGNQVAMSIAYGTILNIADGCGPKLVYVIFSHLLKYSSGHYLLLSRAKVLWLSEKIIY